MPQSRSGRPAHRPSRRHQLIAGAVELFAVKPPELVTIAEIVQQAGMTPAAFYYHFSSREDLLQEIVDQFADEWVEQVEQRFAAAASAQEILSAVGQLLDWAVEQRQRATVFFVTSKGATLTIEDRRQAVTARAAEAAAEAVRRATGRRAGAVTALDALALVTVVESALRAELALDPTYRTLGPRRFRAEVLALVLRVVGLAPEAA